MKNRTWIIIGIVVGAIVLGNVAWYLVSPLFIDNTVDEAFPFEIPTEAEMAAMNTEEKAAMEAELIAALPSVEEVDAMPEEVKAAVEEKAVAAAATVMSDHEMAEPMPEPEPVATESAAEWQAVTAGAFVDADDFHKGEGSATFYQMGTTRILRFEAFSATNGPDLHVVLSKHPKPTSHDEVGEDYIDLGSLKGNMGNQNYEVPDDVDLSLYQSVVIYCVPFRVVFATATLD